MTCKYCLISKQDNSEFTAKTQMHCPSCCVHCTCAAAGCIKSFQKAFEWRKFLVQQLLGKADKTPALCERTCECLQSLGLLLEDHSCRGATTPQLQGCDSHLLAVGAYMTGMRQIDSNSAIMAWLQSYIQVLFQSHMTQSHMTRNVLHYLCTSALNAWDMLRTLLNRLFMNCGTPKYAC